jgi:ketopantoate hydroxymethyltransferase
MVFAVRNLSVLAYANGFTLWHYKAGKERLEAVSRANFFADAADMLMVGDLVMISAADGARIVCVTLSDIETVTTAPLA